MAIDYKLIGKRIKKQRKENNMTQEILSEKIDVTVGYVSQIERGFCKVNLDTLTKIAEVLNCDITLFLSGTSTLQPSYLKDEISAKLEECTEKQKKMVLDFISLILKY